MARSSSRSPSIAPADPEAPLGRTPTGKPRRTRAQVTADAIENRRRRQWAKDRKAQIKKDELAAQERREARGHMHIASPIPRHVLLDAVNTVTFAGGDVPASNTCGAYPEMVVLDPLEVHQLVEFRDRAAYTNPIYTEGDVPEDEEFCQWDIYGDPDDESKKQLELMEEKPPTPIEDPDLRDRVMNGSADLLDLMIFLHLETGMGLNEVKKLIGLEKEDNVIVAEDGESESDVIFAQRVKRLRSMCVRKDHGKRKGWRKTIREDRNETKEVRSGKGSDQRAMRKNFQADTRRARRDPRWANDVTVGMVGRLKRIPALGDEPSVDISDDWTTFLDDWLPPVIESTEVRVVSEMRACDFA